MIRPPGVADAAGRGSSAVDGSAAAGMLAGMSRRVTSPSFVGRREELATVIAALDRAAAGDPVHLLISGEAGVGKTRLTTEAITHARGRGFQVLVGQCVSVGDAGLPYGPLVEILRGVVQDLGGGEARGIAGRAAPDLARLVPEFGSGGAEAPAQAEWAQTRLFEALLGLLTRLAARSPVLLVVEDLHWADGATREALAFLVGGLRGIPVLILATFRADELHRRHPLVPWLADLERRMPVQRVALERFDRDAIGELLGSILGAPAPARLVADVFERSDGNAFFAEELLAASEDGRVGRRLPPTLQEVLLAQVARLPEPAVAVLSAAAVAGRSVEHGLLERIAGLPEPLVLEGLRAAVAAHLLIVETAGHEDRYTFRHALVQEAVYEELLPGERRRLHRTIAEALELEADSPTAAQPDAGRRTEIAHHWVQAREDERAFGASLEAAAASMDAFAFEAALSGYEAALELWDRVADPASSSGLDRVELSRRAGLAAYLSGDYRRAVSHRRQAAAGVDPAADPARSGMLQEQLARAMYVAGDPVGSLEAYREAVATIPAKPPSRERARALSGLGQMLMLLARYEESRALCEEAVSMARAVGDVVQEGHALNTLGTDRTMLGECDEGIEHLRAALRIAKDAGIPDDVGRAYVNLCESLDVCGRTAAALETTNEGLEQAAEIGVGYSYGYYIVLGGVSFATALGRWDVAGTLLQEALAHEPSGAGSVAYRVARTLPLFVVRGEWTRADAAIDEATDLVGQNRGAQFAGPVYAAIAERELWRGDPRAALEAVGTGLQHVEPTRDRIETARLSRVGAWAAADLHEQARARRDEAGLDAAAAWIDRLRSQIAAVVGSSAPRLLVADQVALEGEASRLLATPEREPWREAAATWDAAERPYLAAFARWRIGEAALAAGDTAEAASALREGHAIADRLGAVPLRDAIAALARRARVHLAPDTSPDRAPAPAGDGDSFGLTPRERDVLALVAEGRTNRQIAAELFISESTAGVHVSNILGKLGVASRTEAAALAYRLRLVDRDGGVPPGG